VNDPVATVNDVVRPSEISWETMSEIPRRLLLGAAVAVPVVALVDGVAEAVSSSASSPAPTAVRTPNPGGAPVARPDPVVDPANEIGGTESASDSAVGVVPSVPGASPVATDVGAGAVTRLGTQATTEAGATSLPFSFRSTPFSLHKLPASARPYARADPLPLTDRGVHDASGVRMSRQKGKLYDHPVAQAQYGLGLVDSHRLTGKAAYLTKAVLQAQRLVARRVVRGNGWFYPYRFSFALHNGPDVLPAPWYSMMAQGQALSLFTRLAETTGEARWRTAADHTFASFLLPFAAGKPWGVYVKDGLLRLEEYPHPKKLWGDETYNGHVFSLFGLYDYWALTGNATALALLRGALTTARDVLPELHVRNFRSHYCLRHQLDAGQYHTIHVEQQQMLYAMTWDAAFARNADLLYADAPPITLGAVHGWRGGRVVLARGKHAAYRFGPGGAVLASRVLTATARTSAPARDRTRILGRPGMWYAISAGTLSGWYVQEAPGRRFLVGPRAILTYAVPRPARIRVARPAAVVVSGTGGVSSVRTTYAAGAKITVDARAALNGVEHLRLASGTYRSRWIPSSLISGP
jgi:D-glucuronyl C5-epimerase-like protein